MFDALNHRQWVSARKTHLSIYDAAVDDITEHITIKQMLRQFKDGGFIGGTGPSISILQRRTFARKDKILSIIIPQQSSNYNEKNV